MLKQLLTPSKIFYSITVLLIACYVGILVSTYEVFADAQEENWSYYNSTVTNITDVGAGKFKVWTSHRVEYENQHNHSVGSKTIRGRAEWKNKDTLVVTASPIDGSEDTTFTLQAGPITTTFNVTRTLTMTLDDDVLWEGGAYTNLFPGEWDNEPGGGFGAVEAWTDEFDPDDFSPGVTPPIPAYAQTSAP